MAVQLAQYSYAVMVRDSVKTLYCMSTLWCLLVLLCDKSWIRLFEYFVVQKVFSVESGCHHRMSGQLSTLWQRSLLIGQLSL